MKDPEEDVPPPDDDLQEQEEDEQEDDERRMTPTCLKRLENASQLLVEHMRRDARLHARIGILPVIMGSINGWLINPQKFDCVVMLRIGAERMCCNMVFERMGTAWKCAYSDIG